MATSKYPLADCAKIQSDIDSITLNLKKWQVNLESLRNASPPDYDAIRTARETVEDYSRDILVLKAQQRTQGCIPGGSLELSQDNQTVISTSSVRRKDENAKKKI
jgi:hypothetical protein